jgi:vancomycin permeability regulator SanA
MKDKKHLIKSKPLRRLICIFICLCILGAAVIAVANAYVVGYAKQYILSYEELSAHNFDCVMVLGARKGSPMLDERLEFGFKAFNTGCSDRLLMSGDHGKESYDEVNFMKDFAVAQGIEGDRVFMDHAGFSTYESMYRARDVFEVESVLVVTQTYHLYRAVYDARKLGLEAYGYKAEHLLYPELNNIREAAARVKDFFWCTVKPEPTYLGEAIPISSSGSLTDDRIKN